MQSGLKLFQREGISLLPSQLISQCALLTLYEEGISTTEKKKEIIIWTYAVDGSKYTSSPNVARLAYASISSVGAANCTETWIER